MFLVIKSIIMINRGANIRRATIFSAYKLQVPQSMSVFCLSSITKYKRENFLACGCFCPFSHDGNKRSNAKPYIFILYFGVMPTKSQTSRNPWRDFVRTLERQYDHSKLVENYLFDFCTISFCSLGNSLYLHLDILSVNSTQFLHPETNVDTWLII